MKKKRHSPEQVIRKLRDAEGHLAAGLTIGQVCQKLEISEQTFHRWRNQYGGMKANDCPYQEHRRPCQIRSYVAGQTGSASLR